MKAIIGSIPGKFIVTEEKLTEILEYLGGCSIDYEMASRGLQETDTPDPEDSKEEILEIGAYHELCCERNAYAQGKLNAAIKMCSLLTDIPYTELWDLAESEAENLRIANEEFGVYRLFD